jgi:hypothetical protein
MKPSHLYDILFIIILSITNIQAQEAIPATGGNVSGSGGSVSYSVGQIFYQTQTGSKGVLTEGVQHSYHISVMPKITIIKGINLSVQVYPNPINEILTLEVDNFDSGKLEYLVYDIQGKLLQNARINGSKTSIGMAHLPASTYILNLVKDNHLIKTFKIIKK